MLKLGFGRIISIGSLYHKKLVSIRGSGFDRLQQYLLCETIDFHPTPTRSCFYVHIIEVKPKIFCIIEEEQANDIHSLKRKVS